MKVFVMCVTIACAVAGKIADMAQGAKFTQCINKGDFMTKTADADITFVDKDSNGCCPENTIPGVKLQSKYWGAQVVCGVEGDGSIGSMTSSGSAPDKTCNYQSCYVMKIADKIKCANGDAPLLSGCCGTEKASRTFVSDCKSYNLNNKVDTAGDDASVDFCSSYHKDYSSLGWDGTATSSDDVLGSDFQVDKFRAYASCAKGSPSAPSPASPSPSVEVSNAFSATFGLATLVSVAFAMSLSA